MFLSRIANLKNKGATIFQTSKWKCRSYIPKSKLPTLTVHKNDKMITKDTKQWILMHTSDKIETKDTKMDETTL